MTEAGVSLSTEELFTQAFAQLREVRNRTTSRRGREKALDLVTDLFLSINEISRRVGALTFTERPVVVDDEEDEEAGRMPMAALFPAGADEADEDFPHELDSAELHELRELVKGLRKTRSDYYRDFLAWHTAGCKHERDVVKKFLAIARRVAPHLLKKFGQSQADVGRKLGQGRAAVSIREKQVYEKLLRDAGARGLLGAGARGASTSAKCAKAAKGNKNRAKKKARPDHGNP